MNQTAPTEVEAVKEEVVPMGELGTITIRVVVLAKDSSSSVASSHEETLDIEPDEDIDDDSKKPYNTFLEQSKRGHQCCVFLVNGQRQDAWDNSFITRDLEMKYLRHRMIVVVDCDGLQPGALGNLMQGSRYQFFRGTVYKALEARIVATLKADPDLLRLQEEAEEELANLQSGDEAVKAQLDQLIEAHHDAGSQMKVGNSAIESEGAENVSGGKNENSDAVIEASVGEQGSDPVIQLSPDLTTLRLKPNEGKRFTIVSKPDFLWKQLTQCEVLVDPPTDGLTFVRQQHAHGLEVETLFIPPTDFDEDQFPIEAVLRIKADFIDLPEPRLLERRLVINKKKDAPPPPLPKPLKDTPTSLKITSRQPVRIAVDGPDVHVKWKWDGKNELVTGVPPQWEFYVNCISLSVVPTYTCGIPVDGRGELQIQATKGLNANEKLHFCLEARGHGGTVLEASFDAEVVEAPSPRKIQTKLPQGGQRRPPYDLRYITRNKWSESEAGCWGIPWSEKQAGSFEDPTSKAPLMIVINQDMELLTSFQDRMVNKKLDENTIKRRMNQYTAHVAFHLYQMYQMKKRRMEEDSTMQINDAQLRDEIQRVAHTLLKLMEMN